TRNRVALNEFWAHNATDALELKKKLEERSGTSTARSPRGEPKPAPSTPQASGGAGDLLDQVGRGPTASAKVAAQTKEQLEAKLIDEIINLESMLGCLQFARDLEDRIETLPKEAKARIRTALMTKQQSFDGAARG